MDGVGGMEGAPWEEGAGDRMEGVGAVNDSGAEK
jgi:hypothetical protein